MLSFKGEKMVSIELENPFVDGLNNFLEEIVAEGGKLNIMNDRDEVRSDIIDIIIKIAVEKGAFAPLFDFNTLTAEEKIVLKTAFTTDSSADSSL